MRISLLDRSRTRSGEPDAAALTGTIARAKNAETLGFHRFWVSEHHAVPGIAGSAPAVLLAAIGAHTQRIRIGTGGIMVPNHSPLVVAEQALLLESLYPSRIDLGLGGSLGFTPAVRAALGRTELAEGAYAAEVEAVLAQLAGRTSFTVRPRVPAPPAYLLAIEGGLALAARLGLPAVIGGPLLERPEASDAYFRDFRPNESGSTAQLLVGVDVVIAESAERARELALPEAWASADSRDVGEFRALRPVGRVQELLRAERSARKLAAVDRWLDAAIIGSPDQVRAGLEELLARTRASEILASVSTYDRREVDRIDGALAGLLG